MTDTRRYLPWSAPNSEASPALRKLMREEQRAVPSREQFAAMAANVQRALDPAAVGQAVAPRAARSVVRAPMIATVGAVAILGAGVVWLALHEESVPAPAAAHAAPEQPVSLPQWVATPTTPRRDPVSMPASGGTAAMSSAADASAPEARRMRPTSRMPARPKPQPAAPLRVDPAEELSLLLRARRALVAAPASALRLLEEHARDYPQSTFREEREALAIEAMAAAGTPDRAAVHARRFLATFPTSAYRRRIEAILAAP